VQVIDRDDGNIKAVRYEYPKSRLHHPRCCATAKQLTCNWCSTGIHICGTVLLAPAVRWRLLMLVSYGAAIGDNKREVQLAMRRTMLQPSLMDWTGSADNRAAALSEDGKPLYIDNDITVFSILDTATGTVSSYRFDTRGQVGGSEV